MFKTGESPHLAVEFQLISWNDSSGGEFHGFRYYYSAALWARDEGLTEGTAFLGDTPCTRSSVVTYLWKLAGQPASGTVAFSDVPQTAEYAKAVSRAVEQGITKGTGDTTFSPDGICTRGEIVTFLYRAYAK